MSYKKFQVYFFITVLGMSGVLTLFVFRPYLTLLAFGGVLAVISRPVYLRLNRMLKSATAAAFLTVICMTLAVLLPSALFFASLSSELINAISNIKGYFDGTTVLQVAERYLPASIHNQIPAMIEELTRIIRGIAEALSQNLVVFFSNLFGIVFGCIVVLISAYYLLKDGSRIKMALLALSPLGDEYDEIVFRKVITAVSAVMMGTLVMGLVKGVLAGVFFWAFGVPAPLFWGTMTGFASFIPVFGSALITVPTVLYLLVIGRIGAAIGLFAVSVLIIGAIDNFLQPKLVESKTNIHPLLILLSILGGIKFYGFAGFILGPLTLAVLMALIDIYEKEFRQYLERAE